MADLENTVNRGPDCPEPEHQYISDEPDLPTGRLRIEIVDNVQDYLTTLLSEQNWRGPDWTGPVNVLDFVRSVKPELWRKLMETARLKTVAQIEHEYEHRYDRDTYRKIGRICAAVLRTLLENTTSEGAYKLRYWKCAIDHDWEPLPQALRGKLYRHGAFQPGAGILSCFDPLASTITFAGETYQLAVFKSAPAPAAQPATAARVKGTNRGGAPTQHDWDGFWIEIMRIKASLGGELPERTELQRRMMEWDGWGDREPDASQVRDKLRRLYNAPHNLP